MKKGIFLVGVIPTFGFIYIYIYNVRRKNKKSTSSEQKYIL